MTVAEARVEIVRRWLPIAEQFLQCPARIDDARTEEFEWGWEFSCVPVDPAQCPLTYKRNNFALDRVTGISTPVGNKGVQEAFNYLMKWRRKRAERAAAPPSATDSAG